MSNRSKSFPPAAVGRCGHLGALLRSLRVPIGRVGFHAGGGSSERRGREVLGRWDLLGRSAGPPLLPGGPCPSIPAHVLPGRAEREQHEPLGASVQQLAADLRRDASQAIDAEPVLDALDHERQLALQHEVDLLLALVCVHPTPLSGLQDDQVDPERAQAELAAQPLIALRPRAVERREGYVRLGHRLSWIQPHGAAAAANARKLSPDPWAGLWRFGCRRGCRAMRDAKFAFGGGVIPALLHVEPRTFLAISAAAAVAGTLATLANSRGLAVPVVVVELLLGVLLGPQLIGPS